MYSLREPVTKLIISWPGSLVKLNKGGTFVIKEDVQATSVQLVCGRKHKFFSKTLVNRDSGRQYSLNHLGFRALVFLLECPFDLLLNICKKFAFYDLVPSLTWLPPAPMSKTQPNALGFAKFCSTEWVSATMRWSQLLATTVTGWLLFA